MKGLELKKEREKRGLTQLDLAELAGVSSRTVINWEQSEVVSEQKVKLIRSILSDYDLKEGKSENHVKEPEAIWVNHSRYMMVPLVMHRAQAGFLSGYADEEYYEELPKVPFEVDREYKGRYLCFEVSGDSMDNNTPESLLEGDILLCREVQKHHWRNKLHINQWDFVLVHKDEGILVKRIIEHNTETGVLTLKSLNEYYSDKEINIKDLIAIFNVVDVKRSRRR